MDARTNELISLVVNGEKRVVGSHPSKTLLDVIRDDLNLTGAKKACDDGECGSCFVMLGDKAVKACLLEAERAQKKPIITIEGLVGEASKHALVDGPAGDTMHALQRAFLEKGATQCGYCIPGMIIKANALLINKADPSRDNVISSLSTNLCRCTGYYKIVEAVLYASKLMRDGAGPAGAEKELKTFVGESVARLDSPHTVNGKALYAADLKMNGMLYAKLLRTPHHHARIVSIDTSEAESMEGVVCVVGAADVPGVKYLANCQPQPFVFPSDKVRFLGEAVAAVAATSEAIAEEAASRIKVEYEPLPHVFKLAEAAAEGAPRLWDQASNVSAPQSINVGDVDKAFSRADVVIENEYSVPMREHAAMETEAALAFVDEDGILVIKTPLYHAFVQGQQSIAANLALDIDKVRIVCPAMGGNFGTRGDTLVPAVAGLLSIKTGKPVRLALSRAESILTSCKAPSVDIRYKTGATKDGEIIAIDVEILHAVGAWGPDLIPLTTGGTELCCFETLGALLSHITGPYQISNIRAKAYDVLVNAPRNVPLRGTNANYLPLAYESQIDQVAEALGIDCLEIRRLNAVRVGSTSPVGQELTESINLLEELEVIEPYYRDALERASKTDVAAPWTRGVGLGCGWRNIGYVKSNVKAGAELSGDGRVKVLAGTVEQGQGATTQLAQIVADAVGVPMGNVDVLIGDTFLAPYPVPTFSSITTVATGKAVQKAGEKLRAAILNIAALHLNVGEDEVEIVGAAVRSKVAPRAQIDLAEVYRHMRQRDLPVRHEGEIAWNGEAPNILYGFSTGIMELDVNTETGEIRLLNHVNACDPGTVINPLALEGQVDGAVGFAVGFALTEAFEPDNPATLKSYGLSTTKDMPATITRLFVGDKLERGPFGAKSAGEIPGIAPIPAIINAIAHATGARVRDIPATPERVKSALQQQS